MMILENGNYNFCEWRKNRIAKPGASVFDLYGSLAWGGRVANEKPRWDICWMEFEVGLDSVIKIALS